MPIRLRFVLVAGALGSAVACASIAGLESSDPDVSNVIPAGGDGGVSTVSDASSATGDGAIETAEGVTISPAQIAFVFNCGTSSTAEVTIANNGQSAQPFDVAMPANANFTLKDAVDGRLVGEVPAHAKQAIIVQAAGIDPGGASTDLRVTVGATATSIDVRGDIRGAALSISPTTADFGLVRANVTSAPITATFTNSGNEPVTISGFPGGGTEFVVPNGLTIPAGGSTTGDFVFNAGPTGAKVSVSVTPTVTTPLCKPAPQLKLSGQRASEDVTVGPTSLDFGTIDCLSNPTNQLVVTVANYGLSDTSYATTLSGTRYKIVSGGSGPVAHGDGVNVAGKQTITLGVNPPGNFYGDVVETLTVTPAGKPAVSIPIHTLVTGADMKYDDPDNSITVNQPGRNAIALRNVGNATVCVNYTYSPGGGCCSYPPIYSEGDGDTFGPSPDPSSVGDVGVYLNVSSYDHNTYTAKVAITHQNCAGGTRSAPFCNPPPTLNVTGKRN